MGIAMGGPIYTRQVQIISLDEFIHGCLILIKHLDQDKTQHCGYPGNLLGRFELFFVCKMPPLIVLFLLVELIGIDCILHLQLGSYWNP